MAQKGASDLKFSTKELLQVSAAIYQAKDEKSLISELAKALQGQLSFLAFASKKEDEFGKYMPSNTALWHGHALMPETFTWTNALEKAPPLPGELTNFASFQAYVCAGEPQLVILLPLVKVKSSGLLLFSIIANQYACLCQIKHAQTLLFRDALTKLYNYRFLKIALRKELLRARRLGESFSILFIDLDNLKQINDNHGHLFGSSVLRKIGQLLKRELREIDTVIRYGGDEYVVILLGTSEEKSKIVAERIRQAIEAHVFSLNQMEAKVTASIGIACYPKHGDNAKELISQADKAMYDSKKNGKNRVSLVGRSGSEHVL